MYMPGQTGYGVIQGFGYAQFGFRLKAMFIFQLP